MSSNPVIATLGRHLRLAVIGGGPGSFIGGMHRMAARIDDCYELVAGVLSSDPERAIARAEEIGLQEGRGYSSVARISIKMLPRLMRCRWLKRSCRRDRSNWYGKAFAAQPL